MPHDIENTLALTKLQNSMVIQILMILLILQDCSNTYQKAEVYGVRQHIQELRHLVKTQKEMKSDNGTPQASAAASFEISEMKDQIQSLTSLLSGMNL